jgi:hypothetical protein
MRRLALFLAVAALTLGGALISLGGASALAAATPTATTSPATALTTTGATLNASVNLQGGTLDPVQAGVNTGTTSDTGCYFEYGTASGKYTTYVSCSPTPTNASSSAQAVTAALTGLTSGTTYYWNVVIVLEPAGISLPVVGTLTGTDVTEAGAEQSFTTPNPKTPPVATTTAASNVGSASATLNGTANPENFPISACSFSYTPSGGSATTVPCSSLPSGASPQNVTASVGSGLSSGTAYSYTLTLTYNSGVTVTSASTSFTTLAAAVGAPSALGSSTATLSGTVNPEGQSITGCTFYYGTSAATLQMAPCSVAASSITGTANTAVTAAVTGLSQSTAYVDIIVLSTADGGTGLSAPGAFMTLAVPKATSTAASAITTTTATLNATVNLGGQGIQACGFEWGVNPLSSSSAGSDLALVEPCTTSPAASGNQHTAVTLKGLAPNTTYYFRVIVTTAGGYAIANTESFRTKANTAKPVMTIKSAKINRKGKSAKFTFARKGTVAVTKGFQCALVTVTKGKAASAHYASCKSGRTYTKLKATTYIFSVRGPAARFRSRSWRAAARPRRPGVAPWPARGEAPPGP